MCDLERHMYDQSVFLNEPSFIIPKSMHILTICTAGNFRSILAGQNIGLIKRNRMMNIRTLIASVALALTTIVGGAQANDPAKLNDLQIAHVAYTADNIEIRYAHLALAISTNPKIHEFARTMIRDHEAVNTQALALLKKLNTKPQDNFLSKQLTANSHKLVDKMSKLRGKAFDKFYASNELAYHKAVNGLVANAFIPNIENAEVKALFKAGLKIFKVHEKHAEMMVKGLK